MTIGSILLVALYIYLGRITYLTYFKLKDHQIHFYHVVCSISWAFFTVAVILSIMMEHSDWILRILSYKL